VDINFLLFAVVVFFAFFSQAATGFGAGVIALTLGAFLFPVPTLLNWIAPLVILMSLYMLARHFGDIDWRLFLVGIIPAMGGGMVIGQVLYYQLDPSSLKFALGVVVVVLSLRALYLNYKAPIGVEEKKPLLLPWTLSAGVVHGLIHSGGPLLVYGLNQQKIDKGAFRATLLLVWMTFSIVLVSSYVASGQLTAEYLPRLGILALVLPLSSIAGEFAHNLLDHSVFQKVINVILVFCGLALLVNGS
jgi:uncharacterized membrane protein YfcA